jgi:exosortase
VLIPFISAYLLFIRRKQLPKAYKSSPGWATLLLVAGLGALLAAVSLFNPRLSKNDSLSLIALSFVCLLAAAGFLFLGRQWMTSAAFPFVFLLFMVPLPGGIVNWLERLSKLASAEAAALFFSIAGTPVLRDGTVFQLPGIVIEVGMQWDPVKLSPFHHQRAGIARVPEKPVAPRHPRGL